MSNTPTIEQMNVEITRFEKRLFYSKFPIDSYGPNTCNAYPVMKYHSSWDWLKPVIDKIVTYSLAYPEQTKPIRDMSIVVDIAPAHEKVYLFSKWFNKQQSNEQ